MTSDKDGVTNGEIPRVVFVPLQPAAPRLLIEFQTDDVIVILHHYYDVICNIVM